MNPKFQYWFDNGKIVEALCGHGEYFVAAVTYSDRHADLLAVGQLLDWSEQDHAEQAAKGFESALVKLLEDQNLEPALGLLLSYGIKKKGSGKTLSVDDDHLEFLVGQKVQEQASVFAKNEGLRKLLINLISYFPNLGKKLGMTTNVEQVRQGGMSLG